MVPTCLEELYPRIARDLGCESSIVWHADVSYKKPKLVLPLMPACCTVGFRHMSKQEWKFHVYANRGHRT